MACESAGCRSAEQIRCATSILSLPESLSLAIYQSKGRSLEKGRYKSQQDASDSIHSQPDRHGPPGPRVRPPYSPKSNHILTPPSSVYSAYEHSLLTSIGSPTIRLPGQPDLKQNLPTDITLETLLSVLLLCIGLVLSSPDLKPIQWSKWAGTLEKSKEARVVKEAGVAPGNPYAGLEERPGFWDVRGARAGFGEWLRDTKGDAKVVRS